MMKEQKILIYTDGSSRGNPGPGGWGAIVATDDHVVELGEGEHHTTNNRMELKAAIAGLSFVRDLGSSFSIDVYTDSSYVLNGITKWVFGWQKNGWMNTKKEEVINRDLWQELVLVVSDLKMSGCSIEWRYAAGHAGIPGNERADEIATLCADKMPPKLFNDIRSAYNIDLALTLGDEKKLAAKKTKSKSKSTGKAYSYLSLVNGKVMRDTTWAECEKRVKGVPGAKFKKSTSADDEKVILRAWGV